MWKVLDREDFALDPTWRCRGVRPKGVQENEENDTSRGRVLVTPNTFAREQLCECNNPDLDQIRDCCVCPVRHNATPC